MVTDEPRGMWPAVLPWNTTRTMADVWAEDKAIARSEHARKAGLGRAQQKRQQFVEEYQKRMNLTPRGKIPFAGYDRSEV